MEHTPSVLITGANGFIGSRLCRRFLDEGYHVFAGVRRTADLSLLRDLAVDYRYGDVTQSDSLPAMVAGVDHIVHNAGVVKARTAATFLKVNEEGTRLLFEAAAVHCANVKKIVYISSVAAAGCSLNGLAVTESDPPHPMTAYGRSKLAGEQVALSYGDRLPVVAVRPPGVYGPGDREVFTFFQTVYRRLKPCVGNMKRKLQLVHVDDLCRGIFLATIRPTPPKVVYFIAENRSYTMAELVGHLQAGCGRKGLPVWVPDPVFRLIGAVSKTCFRMVGATPMLTREKAGEILASWEITTDKAQRELGFESQIPFAEGAKQTFEWYIREGWL